MINIQSKLFETIIRNTEIISVQIDIRIKYCNSYENLIQV